MSSIPAPPDAIDAALVRAFAPVHKRALGLAVGITAAAWVFVVTVFHLVVPNVDDAGLSLLGQYFFGYQVDWLGAFVGAWWAFVAGFVAGWFFAFIRNFSNATWLLFVRLRTEVFEASDFLDQI